MTSRTIVLRCLDTVFIAMSMLLMLAVAGLPMEWMLDLLDVSSSEFWVFALFVLFAASALIHAVATSDARG